MLIPSTGASEQRKGFQTHRKTLKIFGPYEPGLRVRVPQDVMDILAKKILGTKAGGYERWTKTNGLGRMSYGPYSMGSKDFDPKDGFEHPIDTNECGRK